MLANKKKVIINLKKSYTSSPKVLLLFFTFWLHLSSLNFPINCILISSYMESSSANTRRSKNKHGKINQVLYVIGVEKYLHDNHLYVSKI